MMDQGLEDATVAVMLLELQREHQETARLIALISEDINGVTLPLLGAINQNTQVIRPGL